MPSKVSKGVSMVHLFNISVQNNEISCDYTPEHSEKIGHVVVDTESLEVKKVEFSAYEYGKKMYVAHVRQKLEEIYTSGKTIPKEAAVIWY